MSKKKKPSMCHAPTNLRRFPGDVLKRAGLLLLVGLLFVTAPLLQGAKKLESPDKAIKRNARNGERCGVVGLREYLEAEYLKNPILRMNYENAVQSMKGTVESSVQRATPYVIPIVFHIMHARGVENLPDSRIQDAMEIIEKDYRALNTDLSAVIPEFETITSDMQIEFRLAQKDPDGYPTSGITRDYSDYTYNGTWDWPEIKTANAWPRDKYINVWICNSSDGGSGSAWAYLPSQVDNGSGYEQLDGIIMSHWCVGYQTPGWERILTHELGHVLNLNHTWGGGAFQGSNACSEDDGVTDTPNCSGYGSGCDTNHTSCGSLDNIQNYMDYAQCPVMFTEGQKTRVHNCLDSSVAERNKLWSAATLSHSLFAAATPRIVYTHGEHANNLLMESPENNGAISSTLTINLVDVSSSQHFQVTNGVMSRGVHYSVANLPAGLTPVVKGTGATTATLTLTGNADAHANADDVTHFTLTFLNAAFTGGNAASLYNPSDNHLKIDFIDPYEIVYQDVVDIDCTPAATWTYFRVKADSPHTSAFGLWCHDGNMFKLETYGKKSVCATGTRNITPLAYGTEIGAGNNWVAPGSYPNQLDVANTGYTAWNGKTAYVGIQFKIFGLTHYGWLRIQVAADGNSMTLLDHAYNPKPGAPIKAGSKDFIGGNESVTAAFGFSTTGLSVAFTDGSTAVGTTITDWEWSFGDGNTSVEADPVHTYQSAGTYSVTLTVSNGGSLSDSATKSVTVSNVVIAITPDFTYSINGLGAAFTDTGTAVGTTITSWQWTFGDGGTSSRRNPSHTYTAAGTYNVTLTASDGNISKSVTKSLTVSALPYCEASGDSQSYEWIAGVRVGNLDNASAASGYSDFTSIHTTLGSGSTAGVALTPGFSGGSYTEYWKIWIDVNKDGDFNDAGEEVFSQSGSSVVSGSFTVPAVTSDVTTRMRVAMRYYSAPPVCGNFASGEVEDYVVTISAGTPVVTADFTYNVDNMAVTFSDASTADGTSIVSWLWDFGDGNTSALQNPAHTYADSGTYTVTLTVSDPQSYSDTQSGTVTVFDDPGPYCPASHQYDYGYITNVTVGGIDNDSAWGTDGYADFTAQSATMAKGTGYSLTVTCQNQHWPQNSIAVYVDWNRDGDFSDSGETVYAIVAAGPYTATVTPPAGAVSGATRMRIRMAYYEVAGPCGADTYFGDVEDYTINVQ